MERERRFFSIVSAIWGVEKSLREGGECSVCYKNFEFEFDKVSDWSWFRTMYDGQFIYSLHIWKLQISWGGFSEWFKEGEDKEHPVKALKFFDNPKREDGQDVSKQSGQ